MGRRRPTAASAASWPRTRRPGRGGLALGFLAPWLAGFLVLTLYPFAISLVWSFCRLDLLNPPRFVGGENYRRLAAEIAAGEGFGQALTNTLYFALVSVPLSVFLGVGLATLLSQPVRGRAIYRTIIFLPSLLPVVATSVLWMWLLDPRDGLVNHGLASVGVPRQLWFQGGDEFFLSLRCGSKDGLVLMSLWGLGNFVVIYLAALADLPWELYEAAALDGAGWWGRLRHVTLPLLTPVIFFNIVIGLIDALQLFAQAYLVSEGTGEPAGATLLISLHLFLAAFQDFDVGYASAVAWMLFLLLAVLTAGLFASARRWVHYQGVRP